MSGSGGAGGTIGAAFTTLLFGATQTTPTISQTTTGAAAVGQDIVVQPQASSQNPGTTGNFRVVLQPRVGAGADGFFVVQQGATQLVQLGAYANIGTIGALFLGPNAPSASNPVIFSDGTSVTVNVPTGGTGILGAATGTVVGWNANGLLIGGTNFAASFGGGLAGIFGLVNAGTPPSANPTGGIAEYATAGALFVRGSGGAITELTPAGEGTQNTQAGTFGSQQMSFRRTTTSAGTATVDIPIATNTNKNFRVIVSARVAAGSVTGTVGDAWGATREALFKNVAGTVSQIQATTVISTFTDTNMTTSSAVLSVSTTNARVTLTAPTTTEGATPTIDWTVAVIGLDN
jgi:hypothetical protein